MYCTICIAAQKCCFAPQFFPCSLASFSTAYSTDSAYFLCMPGGVCVCVWCFDIFGLLHFASRFLFPLAVFVPFSIFAGLFSQSARPPCAGRTDRSMVGTRKGELEGLTSNGNAGMWAFLGRKKSFGNIFNADTFLSLPAFFNWPLYKVCLSMWVVPKKIVDCLGRGIGVKK